MSEPKEMKSINWFVPLLILAAALSRFIPHPFNFTAIGAMALFAGANVRDKKYAYLFPISVMLMTDLYFGWHFSILPVYFSFGFAVWLGTRIKNSQTVVNIAGMTLLSSIVFFLVTNLPFWYSNLQLYSLDLKGTLESYAMAIPFFKNQLAGDLFYTSVLFGIFYVINSRVIVVPLKK